MIHNVFFVLPQQLYSYTNIILEEAGIHEDLSSYFSIGLGVSGLVFSTVGVSVIALTATGIFHVSHY